MPDRLEWSFSGIISSGFCIQSLFLGCYGKSSKLPLNNTFYSKKEHLYRFSQHCISTDFHNTVSAFVPLYYLSRFLHDEIIIPCGIDSFCVY